MRLPPEEETPAAINIIPMIDVVFAMLVFFMLSTLYMTAGEGLPVDLPAAVTATQQSEATLTLTITATGELFLDQEPVTLENLIATVQAQLAPGQAALVSIKADTHTEHGLVVQAMDQLRQIENLRLGIATQQP